MSDGDGSPKCPKCEANELAFNVVRTMTASMDGMLLSATDSGFASGRIYGILEVAAMLEKTGHKQIADIIRTYGDDNLYHMGKTKGEC